MKEAERSHRDEIIGVLGSRYLGSSRTVLYTECRSDDGVKQVNASSWAVSEFSSPHGAPGLNDFQPSVEQGDRDS